MKISFIFILFLFCSLHSYGTTPKIKVYCNPVLAKSTPDPTVIQAPDGMFYLYATEDIHNIPIYKSPDLVNWTFVGTAFTDATRPTFEPKAGLWAPDINHIDGKYVLYYAMSRWGGEHTCGIGCAVADSPAGPFTNQGGADRSSRAIRYTDLCTPEPTVTPEVKSSNADLKELYISSSDTWGKGILKLDPALNKDRDRYKAVYDGERQSLNIWLTAEEEHATVKIYALSGVKHSTVEKDETIKESNDGKGHVYWKIHFGDQEKEAMVRVQVTAQDSTGGIIT